MTKKAYSYIRFSSKEQLKGDSQRRQLESTRQYCKEAGLDLVESMQDLGFSAFHGKHKTEGTLGRFLKLVEEGKIEPGSTLIVENLDRLSREKVMDALSQFTNLLNAGIRIVTLHDKQEYDKTSIDSNWTQLIISITYMARAHEESRTKSKRLQETLANKRQKIREGKIKFTRNTPSWLILAPNRKEFIVIPEVCHAIETIYRMKASGMSTYKIEKQLNMRDDIWKPPMTKKNKQGAWRESYIKKLLYNNRQLIGEFQPHIMKDGKRVPDGLPIKNYFPKIIDEDLFYKVQDVIKRNAATAGQGGGRISRHRNLFTHILKCGLCGSPMHFIDKGKPPKGQIYLQCDASRRKVDKGQKCQARAIRYDNFEQRFFENIDELEIAEIFGVENEQIARLSDLNRKLDIVMYKVDENKKRISNLTKAIEETSNDSARIKLVKRVDELTEEDEKLFIERKQLMTDIKEQSNLIETSKNLIERTKNFYKLLHESKTEEKKVFLRLQINQEIKKIIKTIRIIPYLNKDEALQYFKPKYEKFIENYDKNEDRYGVAYNSYTTKLQEIQNDKSYDKTYYGVAYIEWNNQPHIKSTMLKLKQ